MVRSKVTGDSFVPRAAHVFTIAIIGAAHLGRRIARESALAGYRTILEDISPATLEQGIAWIGESLADQVSQGKISADTRDAALLSVSTASSAEDASRDADLIIETVSDEEEMKIELFTIFDKFARPGAILASTTTSLSITELAEITFCRDLCIGIRFFEDSGGTQRLELVRGRETSDETAAVCLEIGRRMGREVSVRNEEKALFAGY